jgi:hypothetical protein
VKEIGLVLLTLLALAALAAAGSLAGLTLVEDGQFVMLTAAFEAAADQALFADPRVIFLVDSNGSVYRPTRITRPAGELLQELDIQPLSPEDRVSGVIGYTVPADAVIAGIIHNSEPSRFVPIADL